MLSQHNRLLSNTFDFYSAFCSIINFCCEDSPFVFYKQNNTDLETIFSFIITSFVSKIFLMLPFQQLTKIYVRYNLKQFRSGMGNFESDEGQHSSPLYQYSPSHTFYTVLLHFPFLERKEHRINVIC